MTAKMSSARMRVALAGLLVLASAAPALAQRAYVGASLTGDLTRYSGSESEGVPDMSRGGEALGFALRVGTPLGSMWGVEAEFARPAEIETEWSPQIIPLDQPSLVSGSLTGGIIGGPLLGATETLILPPFSTYRIQTRQRNSTLSAGLWVRQYLSARVSMVYLGGVGFERTELETEVTYQPFISSRRSPVLTSSTLYGVRPFVGVESRIAMTDHLQLVPGVRLHGLEGGWLVRPSVGLAWAF